MDNIDIEKIQKLLDVAKKKHVTEFSIEVKDLKISFSFGSQPTIQYPSPMISVAQGGMYQEKEMVKVSDKKETKPTSAEKFYELKAPFVGTFYASPAPGESAYVKIGDRVKKGQTIGILEAMKIMNQLESDVDGEIVEICLDNESFVEFGQTILKIKV